MRFILFIVMTIGMLGCGHGADQPQSAGVLTDVVGGSLDVSSHGQRYYGLYVTTHSNDQLLSASGVLLMPWENRSDATVSYHDGETAVTGVGQQDHHFPGRPLLMIDAGNRLSIVTPDLPLNAYESRQKLEALVTQSLVDAEIPPEEKAD